MTPGRKDDQGKPSFRLVPPRALLEVAWVLTLGGRRYGDDNWRRVTPLRERYLDATLRHLNAFQRGEALDPDTGLSHLAHAVCSLLFILEDELERGVADTTHGANVEGTPVLPRRHADGGDVHEGEDSAGA